MAMFNGAGAPECGFCFEECCWGCEIARKALDPDYEEEEEDEQEWEPK